MFGRSLTRAACFAALVWAVVVLGRPLPALFGRAREDAAGLDELIGLVALLGCWALLGWVALVLVVTALAAMPGRVGRLASGTAAWMIPQAARRAARIALGLTVAAGPIAWACPAGAAPAPGRVGSTVDAFRSEAEMLLLPDVGRPINVATRTEAAERHNEPLSPQHPQRHPTRDGAAVVVEPGDCLWTIAARNLGHTASNAEIAAEWPRWYAANRTVIGADPDLLLPGMVLDEPAGP
jgi:hypothetical protein